MSKNPHTEAPHNEKPKQAVKKFSWKTLLYALIPIILFCLTFAFINDENVEILDSKTSSPKNIKPTEKEVSAEDLDEGEEIKIKIEGKQTVILKIDTAHAVHFRCNDLPLDLVTLCSGDTVKLNSTIDPKTEIDRCATNIFINHTNESGYIYLRRKKTINP